MAQLWVHTLHMLDALASMPGATSKARCGAHYLHTQHIYSEMGDRDKRISQKHPDQMPGIHSINKRHLLSKVEGKEWCLKVVLCPPPILCHRNPHAYTHIDTETHGHGHTWTWTDTDTDTVIHTHSVSQESSCLNTHTWTHTDIVTHVDTRTHRETDTHRHVHTHGHMWHTHKWLEPTSNCVIILHHHVDSSP